MLGFSNVTVADPSKPARVIDWHENGLDFSDALHLASSQGHESLRTFDRTFIPEYPALPRRRVPAKGAAP